MVFDWFAAHGRTLPWRDTRDPYLILVSETMLQQTQVSRVLPYFDAFTTSYPTIHSLADAHIGDVLRVWQGLGYNRRAVYLQRAAWTVVRERGGIFPTGLAGIEELPGVGSYTARAVACFAFDAQVAVVETNVRRSIRWFAGEHQIEVGAEAVDAIATSMLPPGRAWEWNQALMDFGALVVRRNGTASRGGDVRGPAVRMPPVRFEETDRYWRGRIIASLCQTSRPVSVAQLLRELPSEADEYRVRQLVDRLHREGMVDFDHIVDAVELPAKPYPAL